MGYFAGRSGQVKVKATTTRVVTISGQTAYSDAARTSSVSSPDTITADKVYYFAEDGPVSIVVKDALGGTLITQTPWMQQGCHLTVDSGPSAAPAPVAVGTAVLVGGTKAVTDTNITANSVIRLSYKTVGGTPGAVYVSARSASTSFTITSTSGTDTSTIYYEILAY